MVLTSPLHLIQSVPDSNIYKLTSIFKMYTDLTAPQQCQKRGLLLVFLGVIMIF